MQRHFTIITSISSPMTPVPFRPFSFKILLVFLLDTVHVNLASAFVGHHYHNRSPQTGIFASVVVDTVEGPFDASLLENYWQRQPLLIRHAFDSDKLQGDGSWPASWESIIELACHDDADAEFNTGESARLIRHVPNQLETYTLELGPFEREYIDSVIENESDKVWTLLVNDVDRFMPDLSDFIDEEFDFLPRWQRDDAQVSIAPEKGGIGPHVDNYDVFLVQAQGRRNWLVGKETMTAEEERKDLVDGIQVSILQGNYEFSEVVLGEGDALYLPPRIVHWGTSLSDNCMTISVACRAPSAAELTARVAETMLDSVSEPIVKRYTNVNLLKQQRDGPSLNENVKNSIKRLVLGAVENVLDDEAVFDEIVGRLVTESKRLSYSALHPWDDVDDDEYYEAWGETLDGLLDRVLEGEGALYRAEGISFATSQIVDKNDSTLIDRLYACGELFEVRNDPMAAAVFERIEQGHALNSKNLSGLTDSVREVLDQLVAEGFLDASDDSEEDR